MANKTFMRYFPILLLSCSLTVAACSNSLDDFLEEMSESDSSSMFYTDTLTIAHWNIGHFALGKSGSTTISAEDSEPMASLYKALIDSIDADVFGVCEYNPTFSVAGEKTSSYIFGDYPYNCIGSKLSYNCNAIFSRAKLNDSMVVFFEKRVQHRYYVVSKLFINDHEVFFIETHLDWNQGTEGKECRAAQIQSLIDEFRNYPYVIICADYNVSDINEFQPFVDDGFSLANGGELGEIYTYPSSKPKHAIDNIVIKGFKILSFDVGDNAKLSDHCVVVSQLYFLN